MIRTRILPCELDRATCDALNLQSGRIYSGIVSRHWRLLKKKGLWLSQKSLTKLSDLRLAGRDTPLHAHSVDAAQQGFFKACRITRALRKSGQPDAHFPWHTPKYRTTIWKNDSVKQRGATLELSCGTGNPRIGVALPESLRDVLRFLEVRLVYDKQAQRYNWHVVAENGKQPNVAPGANVVSVDPGEIHPAVVGDEHSATVITCRERRAKQRGHARNLKAFSKALARKRKGSRSYRKLVRARVRCKAKHRRVMRDIEHKISRAIVNEAVERGAGTIVYGDVRDIADGIDKGNEHNQRMSQWDHGKVRNHVQYKAQAEGIAVVLQSERNTSKTCPACGAQHKPRGRVYHCPSCGFSGHRDVVGQINILSAFKMGAPGKLPAPQDIKYRIPHNLRAMRKCRDTGPVTSLQAEKLPVAWAQSQEAAGL